MIHYYDLVKAVQNEGLRYNHLKKVSTSENPPISSQQFSKIVKKNLVRKGPSRLNNQKAFTQGKKDLIHDFWISPSISRVSPNKTMVTTRKTKDSPSTFIPIYYRLHSIRDSFKLFKEEYPDVSCSRGSFFKYKPKQVKKPKSKQDACPICKESSRLLPNLEKSHPSNLSHDDRKAIEAFKFHEKLWRQRSDDYDADLEKISEEEAIITIDFKANISLGKGPVEDSHVYFSAPQRTIFGAAAFFKKNGTVYKVMFTIVSRVLNHDSKTALEMLKRILAHGVFDYFNPSKVKFWMDNAPNHFRTRETFASFADLQTSTTRKIEVNFFGEYHGKSECDRHFGLISRVYTDRTSYIGAKDVNTSDDFIELYNSAIRSFGGIVIPSVGANYEELKPESGKELNVITIEFSYKEITESEISAGKTKINIPYSKRYLHSKLLTMNYFYQFRFNDKITKIFGKLDSKSKEKAFICKILEEECLNYQVSVGNSTAFTPNYSMLHSLSNRARYHWG